MVGLDAAGKTTILYKLKLGEGQSCLIDNLCVIGAQILKVCNQGQISKGTFSHSYILSRACSFVHTKMASVACSFLKNFSQKSAKKCPRGESNPELPHSEPILYH